jgi:hypothetical protein
LLPAEKLQHAISHIRKSLVSGNKTWRRAATIGATIGNGSTPGDSHSMSSLINKLFVLRGEDANRLFFARHTFS